MCPFQPALRLKQSPQCHGLSCIILLCDCHLRVWRALRAGWNENERGSKAYTATNDRRDVLPGWVPQFFNSLGLAAVLFSFWWAHRAEKKASRTGATEVSAEGDVAWRRWRLKNRPRC